MSTMKAIDIIDISSSPEPAPIPLSIKRGKTRQNSSTQASTSSNTRLRIAARPEDVIELTDSGDEGVYVPAKRRRKEKEQVKNREAHRREKRQTNRNAEPGPSRSNVIFSPSTSLSFLGSDFPNFATHAGQDVHKLPAAGVGVAVPEETSIQKPSPSEDGRTFPSSKVELQKPFSNTAVEQATPQAVDVSALADPPALAPAPAIEPPPESVDPIEKSISRILEIIPDVDPSHVLTLFEQYSVSVPPTYADADSNANRVVEMILHDLFENFSYPKIDRKGKRKRAETESEKEVRVVKSKIDEVDYMSKDRQHQGSIHYSNMALEQLFADFPYIPKPYVREQFWRYRCFYAPTYLFLHDQQKSGHPLPYVTKTIPTRVSGKRREMHDEEFEREREWVLKRIRGDDGAIQEAADKLKAGGRDEEGREENDDGECPDGIECGCCFSTYAFDKMIQCPDGHLFCRSCMRSYASTLLGEHNHNILCVDQSGCKLPFAISELRRFLTPKLMELYEKVTQRKEIEAANLENLEECPFCDYRCVMDNEQEKLFRCENEECGAVSCRECKNLDHLPKSCQEAEKDKTLNVQHSIEEAMTRALMRNCPKCQKAFIKEQGCNKMTCPNCQTVSCYVCRQIITGYDHFGNPPPYTKPVNKDKCQLWDAVEQRHAEEVTAAARRALEEYKRDHPDVDEKDIKVDLPPPVAGPSRNPHAPPYAVGGAVGVGGARGLGVGAGLGNHQAQMRAQVHVRHHLPGQRHAGIPAQLPVFPLLDEQPPPRPVRDLLAFPRFEHLNPPAQRAAPAPARRALPLPDDYIAYARDHLGHLHLVQHRPDPPPVRQAPPPVQHPANPFAEVFAARPPPAAVADLVAQRTRGKRPPQIYGM